MKNSAPDSRQAQTAIFQFNRYCGISLFAGAIAFALCFLYGDHDLLPALLLLAAWAVAFFGVTLNETDALAVGGPS